MDALIFAAGLGTRLGELGRTLPKALVTVGSRTMLEHVATRLVRAGVTRIVVNVHHHAGRIAQWIEAHDVGAEVVLSLERDRPLETGGGLLHAAHLIRTDGPFFLYNVDVLSEADLGAMYAAHVDSGALVTLAVSARETNRRLLFDREGLLGRADDGRDLRLEVRPPMGAVEERAFAGIHVTDGRLPGMITERGAFPIFDVYLRLASRGARILPHSIGDVSWYEIGTPDRLDAARRALDSFAGGGPNQDL